MKLNTNQIGDVGESTFMLECIKKGFTIAKPFGNNLGYDLIIDNGQQLLTIQVKAANKASATKDKKNPAHHFGAFFAEHADFLVCLKLDTLDFYILPSSAVANVPRLRIGTVSKWDKFKNNWELLMPSL